MGCRAWRAATSFFAVVFSRSPLRQIGADHCMKCPYKINRTKTLLNQVKSDEFSRDQLDELNSVGRASGFVPKFYVVPRKLEISVGKKAFGAKLEVPIENSVTRVSLVTSLFGENDGLPIFRVT